jgi:anti-anti-sigma factor
MILNSKFALKLLTMSLSIDVRRSDATSMEIVFKGKIDAINTAHGAAKFFAMLHDLESDVILDFSKVSFLSSLGLRMILTALKDVRRQGYSLKIVKSPAEIEKVIVIAGLEELLG